MFPFSPKQLWLQSENAESFPAHQNESSSIDKYKYFVKGLALTVIFIVS